MIKTIYKFTVLVLSLTLSDVLWADSLSGNKGTETIDSDKTYELTGDVNLTGTITINKGKTLTIKGNGHTIYTHTTTTTTTPTCSFLVYGTLIIDNAIIDGKNTGTIVPSVGEQAVQPYPGFVYAGRFIEAHNLATVKLSNITAKNLYGGIGSTGISGVAFVHLTGESGGGTNVSNRGSVLIENSTITNCLNRNDSGIIYQSGGANMHGTITIKNTTISHCMVIAKDTGTGYGGVIKGPGSTDCNLIMEGSKMEYCWGSAWGGAILWAANLNGCSAKFTNCTFEYNYARYLGGAISSEATVELSGCTLQHNVAGYGGGALAAFPFTLTETTGEGVDNSTAIGLTLTNNTIYNNKTLYVTNKGGVNVPDGCRAKESNNSDQDVYLELDGYFNPRYTILDATDIYYPTGGGGIWVLMNKDGWNCQLSIEGNNNIYSNHSENNAGGVMLFKQTPYRRAKSGETEYVDNKERAKLLGDYSVVNGKMTGVTSMSLNSNIYSNTAINNGGGVAIGASENSSSSWTFPDVTLKGGIIYSNKAVNGGGIYMPGGNFSAEGGSVYSNEVTGNGGGIYLGGGSLSIEENKELKVYSNKAVNGGAFYLASGSISDNGTLNVGVEGANTATNDGGAIYLAKGDFTVNNKVVLSNNSAGKDGGGIFMANGSFTIKDGVLSNNTATQSGGGIYMAKGTLTINGSVTANNNSATNGNGGAIYLDGGTNGKFQVNNLGELIVGSAGGANTATNGNGGGIYCSGTFNVSGQALISNNTAKNGGGVCVNNGTVSLADGKGSKINLNTATIYGGGLFVTNDKNVSEQKDSSTFSGGEFLENTAKAGGAVCAIGNIGMLLSATIEGNTADIGGGIYMANGVRMTFGNGLIRTNKAVKGSSVYTTASGKSYGTVEGVGGGIFMANNARLLFQQGLTEMGIYNNSADNAGADICVNGSNTTITLPDITSMNLKGFDVPSKSLYWVEDYFENDSGVSSGTNERPVKRYEDLLNTTYTDSNGDQQFVNISNYIVAPNTYTKYLCLDLGYDLVFVTVTTTGLDNFDDAIISFSYPTNKGAADNVDKLYRKLLFTGNDTQKVGLPEGFWKVTPIEWNVKYKDPTLTPAAVDGYLSFSKNGAAQLLLQFEKQETLNHKIKEYSHRKVNRMTPRKNN